jgi:hypothetical protein
MQSVDTEGFEGSEDDKDGGPSVIEGEGEVNEQLVCEACRRVMLLDNVVDVLEYNSKSQITGDKTCEYSLSQLS